MRYDVKVLLLIYYLLHIFSHNLKILFEYVIIEQTWYIQKYYKLYF